MTEPVPALHLSATEVWQYAQAVNAMGSLLGRLRARVVAARATDARLAFGDTEHAALLHEARVRAPLRLMTADEQQAWVDRVPAALTAPVSEEPVTVCAAQMVDRKGRPTGEWGLEAHAWQDGASVGVVMLVCRDASDAVALARQVRECGSVEFLEELRALAGEAPAQASVGLTEADWAAVLRRELPAGLTDRLIVTDPEHPNAAAWRELHRLASEEVARVEADPVKLAGLIRGVPRWRDDVRNPPALAHWALTQARETAGYLKAVGSRSNTDAADSASPAPSLAQVRNPRQALAWANSLISSEPTHRLDAQRGFGRWGSRVDEALATRFPGLVDQIAVTGHRTRRADEVDPGSASLAAAPAQVASSPDAGAVDELAAQVRRLDPTKPIDRRAAHIMLGRVPVEIDRLLADKFADDPQFVDKLHALYPDGLPDAHAASWRDRASVHEAAASATDTSSANASRLTGPGAPGSALAAAERSVAAHQLGVAHAASQQPNSQWVRTTTAVPRRP